MNLHLLFEIADRAKGRVKLTSDDEAFVRDVVPEQLAVVSDG